MTPGEIVWRACGRGARACLVRAVTETSARISYRAGQRYYSHGRLERGWSSNWIVTPQEQLYASHGEALAARRQAPAAS